MLFASPSEVEFNLKCNSDSNSQPYKSLPEKFLKDSNFKK